MYLTLAERIRDGAAPEFFETPSAPEFLHPSLTDPAIGDGGYDRLQSARLLARAARIARELEAIDRKPLAKSTRGAARIVICLTRIDPRNPRRLMRYPTVSAAAAAVNQKCDNVSQAIRRHGTCGGHVYQYEVDLPDGFNEAAQVRQVRKLQLSRRTGHKRHPRGGRLFRSTPRVAAA